MVRNSLRDILAGGCIPTFRSPAIRRFSPTPPDLHLRRLSSQAPAHSASGFGCFGSLRHIVPICRVIFRSLGLRGSLPAFGTHFGSGLSIDLLCPPRTIPLVMGFPDRFRPFTCERALIASGLAIVSSAFCVLIAYVPGLLASQVSLILCSYALSGSGLETSGMSNFDILLVSLFSDEPQNRKSAKLLLFEAFSYSRFRSSS